MIRAVPTVPRRFHGRYASWRPSDNGAVTREPGPKTLSEDDRRLIATWAADCAERVLALFEAATADDNRPREAVLGLRAFARGELRIGQARTLAFAAHAAAREAQAPSAVAAARAAGQAVSTAHMAAHAFGASTPEARGRGAVAASLN